MNLSYFKTRTTKWPTKLLINKKGKGKKREQERKIEIDSQRKVHILAFAHA